MHEGHRARLLSKVVAGDKLYEHEYLEALLFAACPRRDLNGVAHALIEKFGGIEGVLTADEADLRQVKGVGENMALYLRVLGSALKGIAKCSNFACIRNTAQFKKFLSLRADGHCGLELHMLDFDGRVRRICLFEEGVFPFPSRRVIRALAAFAPYGVFAANIRRGDCHPAEADDAAFRELKEICALGGVRLYDFCIQAEDGIYSYFVSDRLVDEGGEVKGK